MNIDLKKLYEQDAEFKLFVRECITVAVESGPNFESILANLYAMYQNGVDVKKVAAIAKMNNRIKPLEEV